MTLSLTPFNPNGFGYSINESGFRAVRGAPNESTDFNRSNTSANAPSGNEKSGQRSDTRGIEATGATERAYSRVRRDDDSDLNFRSRSALRVFLSVEQATPSNQPQLFGVDVFV